MQILAHRGLWKSESDRNSIPALVGALKNGYGVETDIRDRNGDLVISHDPARPSSESFARFLEEYAKLRSDGFLALNIKADGIQKMVAPLLQQYHIQNYSFFDSSIPELVIYKEMGLNYFSRLSDIEPTQILGNEACGVWLDSFYNDEWLSPGLIASIRASGKIAAIVSPDLHKKPYRECWEKLRSSIDLSDDLILLCTDHPDEAKEFFYGKN